MLLCTMRTITRDIVGAYILSSDGKVLLGRNKQGGTYQGFLVIPGGGIEEGETEFEALQREIREETGLDISGAAITKLAAAATGQSEKTLKETGETVLVNMNFRDFVVQLNEAAASIVLKFDDDFGDGAWYTASELQRAPLGATVRATLQTLPLR